MTDSQREGDVVNAFVTLIDSLLDDFDIVELLTTLTEQCAQLLDVASAGLLLTDAHDELHLMAATSRRTHDLELFQLQIDEGPCLDCYHEGTAVSIDDLTDETERWPRFVKAATDAGFSSVHAIPMRAGPFVLGALGLFGTEPGTLREHDQSVAQALAHVATVAILQNHHQPTGGGVTRGLQAALVSRMSVDQATGFLAERLNIGLAVAFDVLRRYAQDHGQRLTDVSRELFGPADRRKALLAALTTTSHTSVQE